MGFFLLALFIAWLFAEFAALAWVAGLLGSTFDALVLVFLVSLVGAWVTRRAGLGAGRRIRLAAAEGKTPSAELADGALILAAGVLLVVPGFVSGVLGAALLVPPVRAGVRLLAMRRFERRSDLIVVDRGSVTNKGSAAEVWDVESWEDSPDDAGPGPSEPGELGGPR